MDPQNASRIANSLAHIEKHLAQMEHFFGRICVALEADLKIRKAQNAREERGDVRRGENVKR